MPGFSINGAGWKHHHCEIPPDMNANYRKKLLSPMSDIEQQIAEAESIMVQVPDDEILL